MPFLYFIIISRISYSMCSLIFYHYYLTPSNHFKIFHSILVSLIINLHYITGIKIFHTPRTLLLILINSLHASIFNHIIHHSLVTPLFFPESLSILEDGRCLGFQERCGSAWESGSWHGRRKATPKSASPFGLKWGHNFIFSSGDEALVAWMGEVLRWSGSSAVP